MLGTTSGPMFNMVVSEAVASETNDGYANYIPELFLLICLMNGWLILDLLCILWWYCSVCILSTDLWDDSDDGEW